MNLDDKRNGTTSLGRSTARKFLAIIAAIDNPTPTDFVEEVGQARDAINEANLYELSRIEGMDDFKALLHAVDTEGAVDYVDLVCTAREEVSTETFETIHNYATPTVESLNAREYYGTHATGRVVLVDGQPHCFTGDSAVADARRFAAKVRGEPDPFSKEGKDLRATKLKSPK